MRLPLDSHLPRALAEQLRRYQVDCVALAEWLDGAYLDASDDALLEVCWRERRVLVTADCRTLPPLLRQWADSARHHGGGVLVDGRQLRLSDVGTLLSALTGLEATCGSGAWTDRVVYLTGSLPGERPTG